MYGPPMEQGPKLSWRECQAFIVTITSLFTVSERKTWTVSLDHSAATKKEHY